MRQQQGCILAVDDEPRYLIAMQAILEGIGFRMLTASNGKKALELVALEQPDLVLLDVKMPGMTGIEVCQQIRTFSTVPVIMLTALAEESDKVRGLDAGADDYVTKPFGAQELLARVRAVLRRVELSDMSEATPIFRAGEMEVDFARKRVTVRDQEVNLTATEYRLLCELVRSPGHVFVPDTLLERVWGVGYEGENHMLRQVVYRLRRKVEKDPRDPEYIQNKPGIGYVFAYQPD